MLRYFIYYIKSTTILVPTDDYYHPERPYTEDSVIMQYHSDYDSQEAAIDYLNENSDSMYGDYAIIPVFKPIIK
jgi:hypothetical protein